MDGRCVLHWDLATYGSKSIFGVITLSPSWIIPGRTGVTVTLGAYWTNSLAKAGLRVLAASFQASHLKVALWCSLLGVKVMTDLASKSLESRILKDR